MLTVPLKPRPIEACLLRRLADDGKSHIPVIAAIIAIPYGGQTSASRSPGI